MHWGPHVLAILVLCSDGPHVTFVLSLAWIGAIAWPALLLAAWARPGLRRSRPLRALAAMVTIAWGLGVWAFLIEPQRLVVRDVRVESAAWRGPPLRIGLIADVHVGPHMSPARVARIAARMNALEPDIVLLAGDYVAGHLSPSGRGGRENARIAEGLAALGRLEAPLGVFAVLGNHDWWYDAAAVERALTTAGVTVLENAAQAVDHGDSRFWIVGLADYESERAAPDWDTALAAAPADADVIALAHWPDVFWEAPRRVALTAAGHSHCGQVNLPIYGRYAISPGAARWPCGLYEDDGRSRYVTGGVGVSVLPVRFRAPPEIVVLTLVGAQERRAAPDPAGATSVQADPGG